MEDYYKFDSEDTEHLSKVYLIDHNPQDIKGFRTARCSIYSHSIHFLKVELDKLKEVKIALHLNFLLNYSNL